MEALRKFWELWKRFGQFLGDVLARVVLTVFYFTILLPFGLGVTLFSDPLRKRDGAKPEWLPSVPGERTIDAARRSF